MPCYTNRQAGNAEINSSHTTLSLDQTLSPGAALLGLGIHQLVQEAKGGHNPADNGTDRREKGNVSLSIPLNDLDVQGRDFVEEKDPGKACLLCSIILFCFAKQQHKLGWCVCVRATNTEIVREM
jgi:hypothetical protein